MMVTMLIKDTPSSAHRRGGEGAGIGSMGCGYDAQALRVVNTSLSMDVAGA
jgi:hypothetical protein